MTLVLLGKTKFVGIYLWVCLAERICSRGRQCKPDTFLGYLYIRKKSNGTRIKLVDICTVYLVISQLVDLKRIYSSL